MVAENQIEYEMGYAADEFGNVLKGAFTGDRTELFHSESARHRWTVSKTGSDFQVAISVIEKPPRKLGLFNLPVLQVCFDFGVSAIEDKDSFMERFHKYFHKGGG
ncbi:MAG: hypothetical protein ACI8XC_004442 [Gammaproteobacteria bacterium]|jgi:hypothetical protein